MTHVPRLLVEGEEPPRLDGPLRVIGRSIDDFELGLALAGVVLTAAGSAAAEDVVISDEARTHFAAGVALLKDPKEFGLQLERQFGRMGFVGWITAVGGRAFYLDVVLHEDAVVENRQARR